MEILWKSAVVPITATAEEALSILNSAGLRIALVADDNNVLVGVLTDGDIRRALLNRQTLTDSVIKVMNDKPITALIGSGRDTLIKMMESRSILHIPLVDELGRIAGLETLQDLMMPSEKDNWVFLMAGGFGTRLSPLTDTCPKPMLPIGGKPILEGIIESFKAAGFKKFVISVHYMADSIKAYFGNGDRLDIQIQYVEEDAPLGTAGALGLLPKMIDKPIIMMNGDVLTRLDFNALLDFHEKHQAKLTMCVREYDMQVPFGVVEGEETLVTSIVEKPVHRFFVNAGIYVVSPEAIAMACPPRKVDMPDLVNQILQQKDKVAKFPIFEYWLDIGRHDDFERAQLFKFSNQLM
jgi:dTDP-glucose pyrophosphorylase